MKQKILDELDANNDEYNALKAELSMNQMGAEEKLTPDQLALEKKKREALKKQMQKNEGTLSAEEEEHIVSNINKAYWAIAKKKMDIQKQADKIHELVDDFKYLSEQTGVTSVETLIPILLSSEEENFRLFDVTNEYNKELETLEVEKGEVRRRRRKGFDEYENSYCNAMLTFSVVISLLSRSSLRSSQLRSKINHYMKIEAKQEEGKSKIKREKQDQIETAKAHSSKADSKYNTDVEVIKKVAPSVTSIFNKVGCEVRQSGRQAARRSQEATTAVENIAPAANPNPISRFASLIAGRGRFGGPLDCRCHRQEHHAVHGGDREEDQRDRPAPQHDTEARHH